MVELYLSRQDFWLEPRRYGLHTDLIIDERTEMSHRPSYEGPSIDELFHSAFSFYGAESITGLHFVEDSGARLDPGERQYAQIAYNEFKAGSNVIAALKSLPTRTFDGFVHNF